MQEHKTASSTSKSSQRAVRASGDGERCKASGMTLRGAEMTRVENVEDLRVHAATWFHTAYHDLRNPAFISLFIGLGS